MFPFSQVNVCVYMYVCAYVFDFLAFHVSPLLSYPQSSSFSSITDSTMSLNIITVTLNMGKIRLPFVLYTYSVTHIHHVRVLSCLHREI